MRKEFTFLLISILALNSFSCKNEKKNNPLNLKTDSIETYKESSKAEKNKIPTITEYNSDNRGLKNIKQPKNTILRNLEIDTTKLFGLWSQDPTGPQADFFISSKSFNVVDFDGEDEMPYILDKNEITVFYKNLVYNGIITSAKNDTLKIIWSDNEEEIGYVKINN